MARGEGDPSGKGYPEEKRKLLRSVSLSPTAEMWFNQLKEKTDQNELLQTAGEPESFYIHVVAVALMETVRRSQPRGIPGTQSLESIIKFIDQDAPEEEQLFDAEFLPFSCTWVAEKWLKDHLDSKPAQIIKSDGLSAPLSIHAKLFLEMYQKFLKEEGISQRKPAFNVVAISPQQL
ncbi:hypothetical protein HY439_02055 [Candidatus Microgenomates bacterium]|nr:hypothetical protein [Candidatus Microgenomates bacterium]